MKAKSRYVRLLMIAGATVFALVCALTACAGGTESVVTTDADATRETVTQAASDPSAETQAVTENVTESVTEIPTEAPTEPSTEVATETRTEAATEAATNPDLSEIQMEYIYPAEQAGAKSETVLSVKDFGAVGDGITDDGSALSDAVNAAIAAQATLEFEEGKTYYVGTSKNTSGYFTTPFVFHNADGVTLKGNGATIKVAPGINYWVFWQSQDIRFENLTFDYAVPVYLVGKVVAREGKTVTFETDMEPYVDSYDYSNITAFSIKYNEGVQERPHMYLSKMEKTGERLVTVTYNSHNYNMGDIVFIPNPGVGHVYSEVVYMGHGTGAQVFENITIRAASSFIMAIKGNNAEFYFENVDFLADENDGDIHMVSWRDGYHCKDNRYPMHWNECDVGVLFDDVFNISGTMSSITAMESDTVITVTGTEFDFQVGDVVDVYDQQRGTFCGTATIVAKEGLTLTLDTPLEKVKVGYSVANREICAPGSTIKNSRFTGTYRFRRDLRVENCVFELLAMWILEDGGVEGPMPGCIDFINCTFIGNGGIDMGAYSFSSGRPFREVGKQMKGFGFFGCDLGNTELIERSGTEATVMDIYTLDDLYTYDVPADEA